MYVNPLSVELYSVNNGLSGHVERVVPEFRGAGAADVKS